ncbi:hypothetical protein ACFWQG_01000 [Rhodococcus sp. NPDC058532]|uniref:hypothetical protein n=1 Tax=Rhodococcus sp. NPDC058532 TaxID=3346540 RepID=UPI003669B791
MGVYDSPFRGSRAVAARQLTQHQLRHDCTRIYRDVYVGNRVPVTAAVRARAAWLFAGPNCVLAGFSAAALHGTKWIDDCTPAEVVRHGHWRAPAGMRCHDYRLDPDEVTVVEGVPVTTAARTGFDLGRRLPRIAATTALDALCNATGLEPKQIADVADRHPGARGVRNLRRHLIDVDGGAQSPPETHTRLAMVDAGLPRPATQIPIAEDDGFVFAHSDIGWPQWRVLVEYDGEHHWTDRRQRAWDIERLARMEALGWTVVRVGAELLYRRRAVLVERVTDALRGAGAPV